MKKIVITLGDPAGIGSEIVLKALEGAKNPEKYLLLTSKSILAKAQADFGIALDEKIEIFDDFENIDFEYGVQSEKTGRYAFDVLKTACKLVKENNIKSIVTAPVSKYALNLAGYNFSGQTEVLQKYLGSQTTKAQMLFVANDFRVILLTRHIPLSKVVNALSVKKVIEVIETLNNTLVNKFGIENPKLAICGVNPHAGEEGLLGDKEQETLLPALKYLKEQGLDITEPKPADTLFVSSAKAYKNNKPQPYDAYIACYHDQGLIPVKMLDFENTVNMTIGLEATRTSPSHGTAFDIAGKNQADFRSMKQAILMAENVK